MNRLVDNIVFKSIALSTDEELREASERMPDNVLAKAIIGIDEFPKDGYITADEETRTSDEIMAEIFAEIDRKRSQIRRELIEAKELAEVA